MEQKKKRRPYGLRKDGLKDMFTDIRPGEIRSYPMSEVNVFSYGARVYELNRIAGYRKYSVSMDRVTDTLRVINNDEP